MIPSQSFCVWMCRFLSEIFHYSEYLHRSTLINAMIRRTNWIYKASIGMCLPFCETGECVANGNKSHLIQTEAKCKWNVPLLWQKTKYQVFCMKKRAYRMKKYECNVIGTKCTRIRCTRKYGAVLQMEIQLRT